MGIHDPQMVLPGLPRSLAEMAPRELVGRTARAMGVDPAEVMSPTRRRPVARARQLVCWMLRAAKGWSFPQIGAFLDRDHSTVMHAVVTVGQVFSADELTRLVSRVETGEGVT